MNKPKTPADKKFFVLIFLTISCSCFADAVLVSEVDNPRFGWMLLICTCIASFSMAAFILWKRGKQPSNWLKYSAIILAFLALLSVVLLLKTPRKVIDHQYQKVENPFAH